MRYRSVWFGRMSFVLVFGMFAAAALALIAGSAGSDDGPPIVFLLFWLAALAWNASWWLFRLAMELRIEDSVLLATAPLRSRRVELSAVTVIRPMKLTSNVAVIEIAGERPVLTLVTKGFRDFTGGIARRRPDLPIRFGWQANTTERMPGRSKTDDC